MFPLTNPLTSRILTPVKRAHAETYLLLTLLGFAASVVLTRWFLQLTGYPQLGGGNLHIAHVLWGGLLLFVAALMPLIYANRWVFHVSAVVSGVGVGLFIDEVGKFITQNNDYFDPLAAPIIYAFFLMTVFLYLQVRRPPVEDRRTEMYGVLDALMEVLDHDLDPQERIALEARLRRVAYLGEQDEYAQLAESLLAFLKSNTVKVDEAPGRWERFLVRFHALEDRWFRRGLHRALLIVGLGFVGLGATINLVLLVWAMTSPELMQEVASIVLASQPTIDNANGLLWFMVRLVLEGVVGLSLVIGAGLLMVRRDDFACRLGGAGLILSLTTVTLVLFYYDQFAAVSFTLFQFVLLLGVARYQHRYLMPKAAQFEAEVLTAVD
ncbi:MAG: hypothetical protein H7175_24120 [Burkholderiales bacterium]|nr:hypothetical protein [Anaerolineae bacterium]